MQTEINQAEIGERLIIIIKDTMKTMTIDSKINMDHILHIIRIQQTKNIILR